MERNQAALGGWSPRVRERHVERGRLRHKLLVRRHHRPQARRILQGKLEVLNQFNDVLVVLVKHLP